MHKTTDMNIKGRHLRDGLEVSEERFTELSTTNNRRNLIAIKLVEDKQVNSLRRALTSKSLSDMKVSELKELAKSVKLKGIVI